MDYSLGTLGRTLKTGNYYAILGVRKDADDVVIVAAYRALAKKYRPDTSSSKSFRSTGQFHLVQEAYDVLSDPWRKSRYDRKLASDSINANKDIPSSPMEAKRQTSENPQSDAGPKTQSSVTIRHYSPNFTVGTVAVCFIGAALVWVFVHSDNDVAKYLAPQFNYQSKNELTVSQLTDVGKTADATPMEHGKEIYGRPYPVVNSSEKTDTLSPTLGGVAKDLNGRELPNISSSGKDDLNSSGKEDLIPVARLDSVRAK